MMKKKIAVFPGSFDPFTKGHEYVVTNALPLFDNIIIAIGYNAQKKDFFPLEQRISWIMNLYKNDPGIDVVSYEGLTVDLCKKRGANYILRGLRSAIDFEYEKTIAQTNKSISGIIETIFFLPSPELSIINSSTIRDIFRHGGDVSKFLPEGMRLEKS